MEARFGFAVLGVFTFAVAPAAWAQPIGDAAAEWDSGEIVVTAQRRAESVLSVPLSIQAATGEQLERAGIRDLTTLQFTTPGFVPTTTSGFTQIFIRAIGNAIYIGADPSVATFVDDVPRPFGSGADNLFDVERVEVLKGAQGGIYGRNATGGVVNIVTRRPSTDAIKANFAVDYGEKNTFKAAGYVNLPLSHAVAVSLSADRASHDPYIRNIARSNPYTAAMFPAGANLGAGPLSPQQTADFFNAGATVPRVNDQDFWGLRGKLLLEPSETFNIMLSADFYDKNDNSGYGNFSQTPAVHQGTLGALFGTLGIATNFPPGFIQTPGKFETSLAGPLIIDIREYGVSATVTWNTASFDITSITAYRKQTSEYQAPVGGDVLDFPAHVDSSKQFFYQELRGVSTLEGPFQLIVGASYLKNKINNATDVFFLSPAINIASTVVVDNVYNWSIYAQGSYDLTPNLNLSISGRYIHETNRALFTVPVVSRERSVEKKFIPSATLSYKLDDGIVYARWAQGFKNGGINLATAPMFYDRPSNGSIFGPEKVDTYEVGYRGTAFDRRLQITAAAFYNEYRDLQVNIVPIEPKVSTAVVNAQSARTWGVEGSLSWRILPAVTLGVNAGYLNARYKTFAIAPNNILPNTNLSGTRMPKAPELQLSFTGNFDVPLTSKLNLVGNALLTHTSTVLYQNATLPILPDATAPGFWVANLRLGVETSDRRFGFAVIADNLFNTAYYVYGGSFTVGNVLGYGNPRVVRGQITARF